MTDLKKLYSFKKEIVRRKASQDLLAFTCYNNIKYVPNWHHVYTAKVITDFINDPKRKKLMIFEPPQHGKSELFSRNLPAFYLGQHPNNKVLTASYSIDLGRFFGREVQRIMTSKEYSEIFPKSSLNESASTKTADYFEIPNHKGFYKTVGVMGGISGFPSDLGVIDDPIKGALEAFSKTYRDRIWEWYLSEFRARLHNDSKQIIGMTRWHEDDLCGRLLELEPDEWEIISIPAIKESNEDPNDPRKIGEALWESKHSLTRLLQLKGLSERTFNSLYQQRPTAIEGSILKKQWFGRFEMSEISGCSVNFKVDTAYTANSANDANSIMAYAIKNNTVYIVNVTVKRLEFPELCRALINDVNIYGRQGSVVYVEPKASGKSVVQQLRQSGINILESKAPTTDKESRVMAISSVVEGGRVKLLNGGSWVDNFLEECAAFPNAKNDDQVDTLVMACEGMNQNNYKVMV